MRKSALEMAVLNMLIKFKAAIATHDRAVVLGFAFSLLPILPLAICGVLIGGVNYLLWRKGELEVFEGAFIRKGLLLGLINLCIGILLLKLLIGFLHGAPWQFYTNWLQEKLHDAFYWIYQSRMTKGMTAI